ncbi:PREDICTED: uncharacterized protein LOC105567892 [Vollenhovia emeryi]|uniref:uncharacterized protein LOC105567892 n=1 Tax=Vollenhovia emeryi TaxID=411798 RepID=UPI0005F4F8CA|nr:PREDICTED: uncharacterized protein LOC105567892 [Vollenhovia emeryi]
MTQATDIDRYLVDDTIFNQINARFIRLDSNDIRQQNPHLKVFFDKLTNAMKEHSPLFAKTFQRIIWVGSYYKGTRFGQPEEYDVNFVINLPFKEKDIEFTTDHFKPGFIKIRTVWRDINHQNVLNLDPKASKELNSFIDDESYLNQEKFRTWMEGILTKVAHTTSGHSTIKFPDFKPTGIRKSGPAFTLKLNYGGNITDVDIDVVPVLAYSTRTLPPKCSKMDILQSRSYRYWSAVPKPLNNDSRPGYGNFHRYWRLCFYEFEKDLLSNHDYGRVKPVIRQLKKLRDTQGWTKVASYYLETLCYHEFEMFHISQKKSHTFLFFKMLEKLRDAFHNHCIKYYWDDDLNLLENIGHDKMKNMEGRIERVLKNIRKTIKDDPYAIAEWVLNTDELKSLIIYMQHENMSAQPEFEPDTPEPAPDQWNCVIL